MCVAAGREFGDEFGCVVIDQRLGARAADRGAVIERLIECWRQGQAFFDQFGGGKKVFESGFCR